MQSCEFSNLPLQKPETLFDLPQAPADRQRILFDHVDKYPPAARVASDNSTILSADAIYNHRIESCGPSNGRHKIA